MGADRAVGHASVLIVVRKKSIRCWAGWGIFSAILRFDWRSISDSVVCGVVIPFRMIVSILQHHEGS